MHYDAIKYEKDRNAGFLSPFGYSAATIAAAVDAVCSMEVLVFTVFCISDTHIVIYLMWFYGDLLFKGASYMTRPIVFHGKNHLNFAYMYACGF